MTYRKLTSPLSGLTEPNVPLVLIATSILAVLLVTVAARPDPAHAKRGNGYQSQNG